MRTRRARRGRRPRPARVAGPDRDARAGGRRDGARRAVRGGLRGGRAAGLPFPSIAERRDRGRRARRAGRNLARTWRSQPDRLHDRGVSAGRVPARHARTAGLARPDPRRGWLVRPGARPRGVDRRRRDEGVASAAPAVRPGVLRGGAREQGEHRVDLGRRRRAGRAGSGRVGPPGPPRHRRARGLDGRGGRVEHRGAASSTGSG
jgi:hypothetical protein